MVYFSSTHKSFIPAAWKTDGTYSKQDWPKDAVLLTEQERATYWKQSPPDGMQLGSAARRPTWIPIPVTALELLHARKVAQINTACETAITAGFWSQALGTPHFYSSQLDDQLNLTGLVLHSQDSAYPCRDEQGLRVFNAHTAAQLLQVSNDFTRFKMRLLERAGALKQQLDHALDAKDAQALEAIEWSEVAP